MNINKRSITISGVLILVTGLAGCGALDTRPTVEQLTNARVAVESAEKAEAKTYAPDDLRRAQDALAIAKDAYAGEAFERSFDFAKKATIYALVAKAKTEQKKSEQKLTLLKSDLEKVKAQTEACMKSSPEQEAVPAAVVSPGANTPPLQTDPIVLEGVRP